MRLTKELWEQTQTMQRFLQDIEDRFTRSKMHGYVADFTTEMKPFVEQVHDHTENWRKLAHKWLDRIHPRHLYPQQIDACAENMKQLCVDAFYPTTDQRRFKHYFNSVHYILEKLQTELEREIKDKARE